MNKLTIEQGRKKFELTAVKSESVNAKQSVFAFTITNVTKKRRHEFTLTIDVASNKTVKLSDAKMKEAFETYVSKAPVNRMLNLIGWKNTAKNILNLNTDYGDWLSGKEGARYDFLTDEQRNTQEEKLAAKARKAAEPKPKKAKPVTSDLPSFNLDSGSEVSPEPEVEAKAAKKAPAKAKESKLTLEGLDDKLNKLTVLMAQIAEQTNATRV